MKSCLGRNKFYFLIKISVREPIFPADVSAMGLRSSPKCPGQGLQGC